jgi:hypothetical protein
MITWLATTLGGVLDDAGEHEAAVAAAASITTLRDWP